MNIMLSLLITTALAVSNTPETRYYMIMFAQDGDFDLPRQSHTFATFIKVEPQPHPAKPRIVEVHTISWYPTDERVRATRSDIQVGKNLDLHSTLQLAARSNYRVSAWGPYQIHQGLYDRAVIQKKRLESGMYWYRAFDYGYRGRNVVNCYHAVSDIGGQPLIGDEICYGSDASSRVLRYLSRWFVQPQQPCLELRHDLGLTQQRIGWGS